jgi:chromosomal replication initiation ATPase DnaA
MRPNVAAIAVRVLEYFGFGYDAIEQLESPRRDEPYVAARHVTAWLARERLGLSYPELGREFGDRDHSTMMPAVRRVAEALRVERAGGELTDAQKKLVAAARYALEVLPGPERREPGVIATCGAREIDLEATG